MEQRVADAAAAFCNDFCKVPLAHWPSGGPGLRNLAALLEHLCEGIDEGQLSEDAVLEGAGALLAVLIADALSGTFVRSSDQVLLRIGAYGCFNPFDAVRRALDDDEPAGALRDEVALAEAEANGTGPHASVVKEVVSQVHAKTTFSFVSCDHAHVTFTDSLQITLAPLLRACAGEAAEVLSATVGRVVGSIPQSNGERQSWDEVAARLMPRLVSAAFMQQMQPRGLVFVPLLADLHLAFVVEDGKMFRYLRDDEVPAPFKGSLSSRAVENLEARSSEVRVRSYGADPRAINPRFAPLSQLTYGDGFDASRLCLPALCRALCERFGADCALSVPHRDALLVAAGSQRELLKEATEDAFTRAPHALSRLLFEFVDGKLGVCGEVASGHVA